MIKRILDFQERFSNYESIGGSAFIDRGNEYNRSSRQIKSSEIIVSSEGISISIDHRIGSYLKNKLSPIIKAKEKEQFVDTNKLLLAIVIARVYFEEKEESVYFPLVSVDLTEKKNEVFQSIKNGSTKIMLDWNTNIVLNEPVLSTLFDITYEENGINKLEMIAETLGDLVYEGAREDTNDFMDSAYEVFIENKNTNFDLVYPKNSSDKSALFMFFNQRNEVKLRKEYGKIKKSPSPLLGEYLTFQQEKNISPLLSDNDIWLGSLTKEFPLGHGQAIVMQRNSLQDRIIPVIGGPGTGKTTLFLSLIASEVTKRAITIASGGQDYNNMILITSTANKAIDNVSSDLRRGFKHGFCYVGGNQVNKTESAKEVKNYISFLNELSYSKEKQEYHAKKVMHYVSLFEKKKEIFNEVKGFNLPFKNTKEINAFLEKNDKHVTIVDNKMVMNLELMNISLDMCKNILKSPKYEIYKDEIIPTSVISKFGMFFKKDKFIDIFNEEFNLSLDRDDITKLLKILSLINERDIDNFIENRSRSLAEKAINLTEGKESFLNGIFKSKSFSEYFRTNLFKMNYDLYIFSLNFMNQEILRNKDEILKSIGFLIADNQYEYIVNNYGYEKKNHDRFLRFLSMAYPVTTSTLAAISSMFASIKSDLIYRTIMADEAGMIASHSIVPALNKASRAIIVGDPKQLSPIVQINDLFLSELRTSVGPDFWEAYSPTRTSAFHRAAGTLFGGYKATGRGIVLDEHRRCVEKIANLFIDIAEYDGLKVCTRTKETKELKAIGENLWVFDVKNTDTQTFKKINFAEISQIRAILNRLESIGYNLTRDVGIITPYKDQERELINNFAKRLNHVNGSEAKIGTVHKFQGVEYKVIIFSTVISRQHDSLSFINVDPSMINVAVSRAKEVFMVVCDSEKLIEDNSYTNYAGRMVRHIELNGKVIKEKKIEQTQHIAA